MVCSSGFQNVVTPICLGTTDEEGWKKYDYSDSSALSEKPLARKKQDVKEENEKEKKAEALLDKMQDMALAQKKTLKTCTEHSVALDARART